MIYPYCKECDWFVERTEDRCWQEEMTGVIALYERELMNRETLEQIIKAQRSDILALKRAVADANARLELKLQIGMGL